MNTAEFKTGRYQDDEGWHTCLYRLGRTRVHLTMLSSLGSIIHRTVPLQEAKFIEPLMLRGNGPYPLDRMVRRYRSIGRAAGVSDAARAELERATLVAGH